MIEPHVVKLLDKEYMFHFNNYAISLLGEVTGQDPVKATDYIMKMAINDPLVALTMVLYTGIAAYQKSKANFNHGIKIEDISSAIAVCDINQFTEAWESFKQCTGVGEFLKEQAEIEAKKEEERLAKVAELEKEGKDIPKELQEQKKNKLRSKESLNTQSAK